MVGAGIFALLGEAAALAGTAVWVSFLMAGVIALLTGYSFVLLLVTLSLRKDQGRLVGYLSLLCTGVTAGLVLRAQNAGATFRPFNDSARTTFSAAIGGRGGEVLAVGMNGLRHLDMKDLRGDD